MNITADATLPRALGTFGYDDEGTPAQRVDIVREGTWVGVLSGRDSAAVAGLPPGGMVRGDGYARLPMVRMTNVGLAARRLVPGGDHRRHRRRNLHGHQPVLVDRRQAAQLPVRLRGRLGDPQRPPGRMLRNPTYTGITPQFWGSLDMLAGGDEWVPWGVPNCGKGQPMQIGPHRPSRPPRPDSAASGWG